MKDLREKAETGPDATRFADAEGSYVIESPTLWKPREVSDPNSYPEYGDWLQTKEGFLECPQVLAKRLVEAVDHDDLSFPVKCQIDSTVLEDDRWSFEGEISQAEEEE
jgi:hypothetical protein